MSSESFKVFVTHVDDSPTGRQGPCLYFWGQKNRSAYLKLESYLNSLAPFNSCSPPISDRRLEGQVLCALIDQNWFRVKIMEPVMIDQLGLIEVFCIDIGMVKSVSCAVIRMIPNIPGSIEKEQTFNLKNVEPLANKFVLADVIAPIGQWTESALSFLKDNMENLYWEALPLGIFSDHIGVRLYNINKSLLLATVMIEKSFGAPAPTYQAALTSVQPKPTEFQAPYLNVSPVLGNSPLSSKPFPLLPQPQFPSSRYPAPTIGSLPSLLPQSTGGPLSAPAQDLRNFRPEPSPVYNNLTQAPTLTNRTVTCNPLVSKKSQRAYVASEIRPGIISEIKVTYIQNGPHKFTVQLKEAQFGLNLLRKQIDSLQLEPMVEFSRGSPCIALSSLDQRAHRGLINMHGTNSCQVYYIDFGHFEKLNKRFIFQIPDELVRIRLYACRIGLADIEELNQFDPDMVCDIFSEIVLDKYFECEVVGDELVQKVIMYDANGADIKQMLISLCQIQATIRAGTSPKACTESVAHPNRPKTSATPVHGAPTRTTLKVLEPTVNREEKLFVTYVGANGEFFGQLEGRPLHELNQVLVELADEYDKKPDSDMLYSDVRSHCGDFAVIKWSADGNFYRVRIKEELANDIIVQLVDFGNVIKVPRSDVLATVSTLKHFTRPAFGITCVCQGFDISEEEWIELLNDKSVHVKIGACTSGTYHVTFTDALCNRDILISLEANKDGINSFTPARPSLSPDRGYERKRENGSNASEKQPTSLTASRRPPTNYRDNEDSNRSRKCGGAPNGNWRKPVTNDNTLVNDRTDREEPAWGQLRSRNDRNEDSNRAKTFGRVTNPLPSRLPPKPAAEPGDSGCLSFYPRQPALKDGTLEIVYVQNPQDFYCQPTDAIETLNNFMSRLATTYENNSQPCIGNAKVDVACVAMYIEDGSWYRGQVISVEGAFVEVLFVDYGNRQKCARDQIKVIKKQFLDLPPQAYHCCLAAVEKKKWTEEDKTKLESATINKPLRVNYIRRSQTGKYHVVLVDEGVVINEMFGYPESTNVPVPKAGYTPLPLPPGSVDVNVSWYFHPSKFFLSPVNNESFQLEMDLLEEFYSSLGKTTLQEADPRIGLPCVTRFSEDQRFYRAEIINIRGQTAEVVYVDYGNIEEAPLSELKRIVPYFSQFPRLAWSCFLNGVKPVAPSRADFHIHETVCFLSGKPVTAVFHAPQSDGRYPVEIIAPSIGDIAKYLTSRGVVKPAQDYDIVLPQQLRHFNRGEIISSEASVSYTKSTNAFWIQSKPEEVDAIMTSLASFFNDPSFIDEQPSGSCFTKGAPCLAISPDDEQWYRAVVESNDEDNVLVNYIDYGNSGSVGRSQLRKMPVELTKDPAMALKCSLDGVENGVDYTEKFIDLVDGTQFTVEFVEMMDGAVAVRLYYSDGTNLNDCLQSSHKIIHSGETNTELLDKVSINRGTEKELNELIGENDISVYTTASLIQRIHNIGLRDPLTPPTDDEQDYFSPKGILPVNSFDALTNFGSTDIGTTDSHDAQTISSAIYNQVDYETLFNQDISMLTASMSLTESRTKAFVAGFLPSDTSDISKKEDPNQSMVGSVGSCVLSFGGDGENDKREYATEDIRLRGTNFSFTIPSFKTSFLAQEIISSDAILSHFVSVNQFWIQPEPKMVEEIMALSNNVMVKSILDQQLINCGEYCLVFDENEDMWYRGVINSVVRDIIFVSRIDYGSLAAVSKKQISGMPAELGVYPAMAVKCSLEGEKCEKNVSSEQFLEVTKGRKLMVEFLKMKGDCLSVELYDSSGRSLRAELGLSSDSGNEAAATPTILDDSIVDEYLMMMCRNKSSQEMNSIETVANSAAEYDEDVNSQAETVLLPSSFPHGNQCSLKVEELLLPCENLDFQPNEEVSGSSDQIFPATVDRPGWKGKEVIADETRSMSLSLSRSPSQLQAPFEIEELISSASAQPKLESETRDNSVDVFSSASNSFREDDEETVGNKFPSVFSSKSPSYFKYECEMQEPLTSHGNEKAHLENEPSHQNADADLLFIDNVHWKEDMAEDKTFSQSFEKPSYQPTISLGIEENTTLDKSAQMSEEQVQVPVDYSQSEVGEITEGSVLQILSFSASQPKDDSEAEEISSISRSSLSQLEVEDDSKNYKANSQLADEPEKDDKTTNASILPILVEVPLHKYPVLSDVERLFAASQSKIEKEAYLELEGEGTSDGGSFPAPLDKMSPQLEVPVEVEEVRLFCESELFQLGKDETCERPNKDLQVLDHVDCRDSQVSEDATLSLSSETTSFQLIPVEVEELLTCRRKSQLDGDEEMEPLRLENRDDINESQPDSLMEHRMERNQEENKMYDGQDDSELGMCQLPFISKHLPENQLPSINPQASKTDEGQGGLNYPQQERIFTYGEVISSDARLLCSNSASEFWIQPNPQIVEEIGEQIERLNPGEELDIVWANGNPCLVFDHNHEISFRALITSIQGAEVKIFCVDYGYTLVMDQSQLRRIPLDLMAYPVQAIKCSLVDFESSDAAVVGIHILKMDAIDAVSSKITVKYVRDESSCIVVQLVDAEGLDLTHRLKEILTCCTKPIKNYANLERDSTCLEDLKNATLAERKLILIERDIELYPEADLEETEASSTISVQELYDSSGRSLRAELGLSSDSGNEAAATPTILDDSTADECLLSTPSEVLNKTEDEIEPSISKIGQLDLTDNESVGIDGRSLSKDPIGFFISHFISPHQFWIQLKNRIEDLEILEQHIAKLDLDLITNKKYSREELNLVYHPRRQMWCRARIECDVDVIRCLFVDYGDRCNVTMDDIVPCPNSLKRVGVFAQECCVKENDFDLFERWSGLTESLGSTILCQGILGGMIDGTQEILSMAIHEELEFDVDEDENEDGPLDSSITHCE